MVSDAMAFLPEHVHLGDRLGDRCAWHGTVEACKARGLCAACASNDNYRFAYGCSGYCSNNLYPSPERKVPE